MNTVTIPIDIAVEMTISHISGMAAQVMIYQETMNFVMLRVERKNFCGYLEWLKTQPELRDDPRVCVAMIAMTLVL